MIFKSDFDVPENAKKYVSENAEQSALFLDGKLVGYYFLQTVGDAADLLYIEVEKSFRSKGYGKILLSHCVKTAISQGAEILFLEVESENLPAKKLYEGAKFLHYLTRKNYYGEKSDALCYKLVLNDSIVKNI